MKDATPHEKEEHPQRARPRGIPVWLGACLFAGIALFFLWEEHEAHILGALPYLLFLACPIIHLLMHRGHRHGGHVGHGGHGSIAPASEDPQRHPEKRGDG